MTETNDSNIEVIVKTINDADIQLVAISDCVEHTDNLESTQFSQHPFKSSNQTNSERLFKEVIEKVDGYLAHIDLAEQQLLRFDKKKTKPMPWNAELSIGSELRIKVSAFVNTQEEKFLTSFKMECVVANTVTRLVTEYTKNNETIEKPDDKELLKAYMYGSQIVPLHDKDEVKNTEQCLACLGFTKREYVLSEHLAGKGCHTVLARKDSLKSASLFASLVAEMQQGGHVMIARKVYRKGLNPMIVALLPNNIKNIPCFTMIQLPFSNDVSVFEFPKLQTKRTEPSKEQERAIAEFVNAMDLMNAIDDTGITEAFALETSLNPVHQHMCRSIAYRALHPTDPLPKIDPELVAMIDVPPKIKKASESILSEIEELFPLEVAAVRVKKVFGQNNNSIDAQSGADTMDVDDTDTDIGKAVIAVGTVTPAEDFAHLLKKGERFTTVTDQMQTVIFDLIFRTASLQLEKILECLVMYREQSKIYGPFTYNNWIKELKTSIVQRNRVDFWQEAIVKEGLGLITVNESPISTVSIEDQLEFYEISSKDAHQTVAMEADEDDLDALLG